MTSQRRRTCASATCTLTVALILLAGCGRDAATVSTAVERPTPPALSRAQEVRANARAARLARIKLERTFAPNPYPEPPASRPHPHRRVTRLIVREVKRGKGPPLRGDERVYADFVKTYWLSGRKFLVAWGPMRAEYLDLTSQPPGIRRGMTGMRPGGRRVIVMPRTISDVHPPDGSGGFVSARVDTVLRKILGREE